MVGVASKIRSKGVKEVDKVLVISIRVILKVKVKAIHNVITKRPILSE